MDQRPGLTYALDMCGQRAPEMEARRGDHYRSFKAVNHKSCRPEGRGCGSGLVAAWVAATSTKKANKILLVEVVEPVEAIERELLQYLISNQVGVPRRSWQTHFLTL